MLLDRAGLSARVRAPSESALRSARSGVAADLDWATVLDAAVAGSAAPGGLSAPRAAAACFAARFGGERMAALIARADAAAAGRFDLLGHRDLGFGEPIDWRLDATSGVRAPADRHWSAIDYLNTGVAGDKKVIWELNRHAHFVLLGRAYALTGDGRYARAFARQLESWLDANPAGRGINWASSLEVSLRSISWLWALQLFAWAPELEPPLLERAIGALWQHGRHIEAYLSTYFSPNTHLTGEALGLLYLGRCLPVRDASRWASRGQSILLESLGRQVRSDGVYFEQSLHYHHYTVEFYTHAWLLGDAASRAAIGARLPALLDVLLYTQRPDGRTPLIGDDDGGRLFGDPADENDFRGALSTGAALLGRPDYKFGAGRLAEETVWLLGADGAAAFDALEARPPADASRAFTAGGYYVMRDGWSSTSNYLLIDCGPHGSLSGGHAHADALSIEVSVGGRPAIVDPGTFTYTGSRSERDRYRGTAAHNTLVVDGLSSSQPDGPFSWKSWAACRAGRWASHPRFDYFDGEHDGYGGVEPGLRQRRSVLFIKGEYWLLWDRVPGTERAHAYALRYQLAPGVTASAERDTARFVVPVNDSDEVAGAIAALGPGAWSVEPGAVASCYGRAVPAPALVYAWHGAGAQDVLTLILPLAGASAPRVREQPARGARAACVEHGAARDTVLWGDGGAERDAAETARLRTDAALLWARFDAAGEPVEVIVVGGSYAEVDGVAVLRGADPAEPVHTIVRSTNPVQPARTPCAESVV